MSDLPNWLVAYLVGYFTTMGVFLNMWSGTPKYNDPPWAVKWIAIFIMSLGSWIMLGMALAHASDPDKNK